jgi:hypothetical protein
LGFGHAVNCSSRSNRTSYLTGSRPTIICYSVTSCSAAALAPGRYCVTSCTNSVNDCIITLELSDSTVIESTPEHPYWNPVKSEWSSFRPDLTLSIHKMQVSLLSVGDKLLNKDGSFASIVSADIREHLEQTTYNLSVDPNPTYYANGFLVHNKLDSSLF